MKAESESIVKKELDEVLKRIRSARHSLKRAENAVLAGSRVRALDHVTDAHSDCANIFESVAFLRGYESGIVERAENT